jgi:hypothetical protein
MSEHTSGKWEQVVDTVWRGGNPIVCHPHHSPQSIADARLVAAAPKLLKMLQDVAGDGICMKGFHEQFRQQIRDTIKLATLP